MAKYLNGVLDLRTEETPPTIIYSLVLGDTFRRVISVVKEETDFSNATASFVLRDAKAPAGEIIYTDVTIPVYDVVLPDSSVTPAVLGSGKFTIDIPSAATEIFPQRKLLYGLVRMLLADSSVETLFTVQISLIQA